MQRARSRIGADPTPDRTFEDPYVISLGKTHRRHQTLICNNAVYTARRIFGMLFRVQSDTVGDCVCHIRHRHQWLDVSQQGFGVNSR